MKRAILHIGYPKTASTWFQSEFYPRLANFDYVPQQVVREGLRMAHTSGFSDERARRIISDATASEYIILCKEDLSGDPHEAGQWGHLDPQDVAERLWATFGQAGEVIVVIRNQISAVASSYGQYLRRGGSQPPGDYILPANDGMEGAVCRLKLDLQHFDYDALISHYEGLFGLDRVHVFPYEAFVSDPEGFIQAFAQRLNLGHVPEISRKRRNPGYGRRMYPFARGLNRFGGKPEWTQDRHLPLLPNRVRKAILGGVARLPGTGTPADLDWLIGPDGRERLAERFAQGNQRLAERHGLPLGRFGYPGSR